MKDENIRRTAKGVNLENRIKEGLTKFFEIDQHERAKEYSEYKGSYVTDCYKTDKNGRSELAGYVVPN